MRALIVRELIVAARRAALPLTAWAVAVLLTGFVLVWAPGLSVLAPLNLYDQTRYLQWILLAAVLPWAAVRSMPDERADQFVLTSALIGVPPAALVSARVTATSGLLLLLIASGLPSLVLAQQISAVPVVTVVGDVLPLVGLAMLTAVAATASRLAVAGPLAAWLACQAIIATALLALLRGAVGLPLTGAACAMLAVVGAGWLRRWSTGALQYLRSDDGR